MDNAGSEYIFLNEFFRDPSKNRKMPLAELNPTYVFNEIFEPTIKLIQVTHLANIFRSLIFLRFLSIYLNSLISNL